MSMTPKGFAEKTSWELRRTRLWGNYLMFQEKGGVFGRILSPNVTDDTSFKKGETLQNRKITERITSCICDRRVLHKNA